MPTTSMSFRIDLTALAASPSHQDGDGHRWSEEEARQWLNRMGTAFPCHPAKAEADRLPLPAGRVHEVIEGR